MARERKSKWFVKDGRIRTSTAPVDHVQFRHEGWTQFDTEDAAKAAAAGAADQSPPAPTRVPDAPVPATKATTQK